jgi:hypothetical protein
MFPFFFPIFPGSAGLAIAQGLLRKAPLHIIFSRLIKPQQIAGAIKVQIRGLGIDPW